MLKRCFAHLVALLLLLPLVARGEPELLAPDQAFPVSADWIDSATLRATWQVAEGYYLYQSKFRFSSQDVNLGEPRYPTPQIKQDEFFGEVAIYRGLVAIELPVDRSERSGGDITLEVTAQGCADIGVCYPPHHQQLTLTLPATTAPSSVVAAATTTAITPPTPAAVTPAAPVAPAAVAMPPIFNDPAEDEVLEPDQAFQLSARLIDAETIGLHWQIAPGHYLYRDKFAFTLNDSDGVAISSSELPPGEEKNDEFFGRIQVHHDSVSATLRLQRDSSAATNVTLQVKYQGCAEIGICYPPIKKPLPLQLPAVTHSGGDAAPPPPAIVATAPALPTPAAPSALSEQDSLAASLASGNTLLVLLTFLGLGLLLAFTPCVFPMIPILSSIIVGQGEQLTTRRAFTLSLIYVLAMALTYTIAGVIAGLFGANIQAAFQNPWVLSSFALVFVALALSMFGFYELQLPSSLQGRLTEVSNRQQGGTLTGVAVMGLLSALIVGPCVAPPLMGALIYIGQTGDPWLGGAALFALSIGMGAPLVAIGTAGGKLLPRAGGWMDAVKGVFGVLLLAVAVWMLERILPPAITMLLWALLCILPAIYMGALEPLRDTASGWQRLWKGLGLVLLIHGALLLVGSASGSHDPLQPLLRLGSSAVSGGSTATHLQFQPIKSRADLDREVSAAASRGQPVMLDFYADWCVSCKEFEKYTFSDPGVIAALDGVLLLQADVTANDDLDQALLRSLNLIGPPALIFYDGEGRELRPFRLVGFQPAAPFTAHVNKAFGR